MVWRTIVCSYFWLPTIESSNLIWYHPKCLLCGCGYHNMRCTTQPHPVYPLSMVCGSLHSASPHVCTSYLCTHAWRIYSTVWYMIVGTERWTRSNCTWSTFGGSACCCCLPLVLAVLLLRTCMKALARDVCHWLCNCSKHWLYICVVYK